MSVLQDQITKTLPLGMFIPRPLELLFSWIEDNDLFVDTKNGRIGFLFPQDQLKTGRTKTERPGGTNIEFFAEGNTYIKSWFGHESPEVLNRLCVFARTGAEGSMAAFWLDDDGKQRIVHLGSGSGSIMVCVLADEPVDFLRLIAIGYDEICWNDHFLQPPNADPLSGGLFVHPNTEYQNWVKATFSVDIPRTAAEIVKHPAEMGDKFSADPFLTWVEMNVA